MQRIGGVAGVLFLHGGYSMAEAGMQRTPAAEISRVPFATPHPIEAPLVHHIIPTRPYKSPFRVHVDPPTRPTSGPLSHADRRTLTLRAHFWCSGFQYACHASVHFGPLQSPTSSYRKVAPYSVYAGWDKR